MGQLGVQMLNPCKQYPLQLFTAAQSMLLQYGAEAPIPKIWTYPMRIITGCVKPIPKHLSVLSRITPANLRKNYVSNKICYHACANEEHPLHSLLPDPQSLRPQLLKSRHPFYRHAAEHYNCDHDIIEARNEEWTKYQRPKWLTLTLDTTADPIYL